MFTWDVPSGERLEVYQEKARTAWLRSVLQQPGVKEVRGYHNPHHTTPQVMIHVEFATLDAWQRFLASERYGEFMFELRAVGCTHIAVQVWETSPLLPEPAKPSTD
jgi:heme-degrading monooxygenase HmoA